MREITRNIGLIGAYLVTLFLLTSLVLALGKFTLPQSPIVLSFFVAMTLLLLAVRKKMWRDIGNRSFWIYTLSILAITFGIESYIVNYLPFEWATDPELCKAQAEYMLTTWELKPETADYFYMYPYNINISVILALLYKLFGDYTLVIYVFLLWVNASSLLAALTVRNITGNNLASIVTLALLQIFCIFTTRTYMPYTSNLALLFPILLIYIYTTKLSSTKKAILVPLLAAFGWQAKLTSLIALIAIVVIEAVRYVLNRKLYSNKDVAVGIVSTILSLALCAGLKTVGWNSMNYQQDDNKVKGFAYYLYLGQNTKSGGQWDEEYVKNGTMIAPSVEREAFYYSVAKRDFMDRGIMDNVKFYVAKTAICWGCTYMDYTRFEGKDNRWVFTLRHCVWFFIFVCAMISIFVCRNRYNLTMMLTLIGVMFYLFLSEGSFTYVIMFSPIIFAMAGITMAKLTSCPKSQS